MSSTNQLSDPNGSTIGLYTKAIGSLVVTGLTAYITAAGDGDITTTDVIVIVVAVIAALGVVWAIPSTPLWLSRFGKAIAAALVAGLSSLIIGLQDGGGLNQVETITAIIAFLTALGLVGVSPNAASSDPTDARGRIVPIGYETKQTLAGNPGVAPPPTSTR
jgi:hypothetical protein